MLDKNRYFRKIILGIECWTSKKLIRKEAYCCSGEQFKKVEVIASNHTMLVLDTYNMLNTHTVLDLKYPVLVRN